MRILRLIAVAFAAVSLALTPATPAGAQPASIEDLVGAVVRIKTFINPDGRSVSNLGRERDGSGILIDENGLVLTIGYLMVEAHAAEVDDQHRTHGARQRRRLRPRHRPWLAAHHRAAEAEGAADRHGR